MGEGKEGRGDEEGGKQIPADLIRVDDLRLPCLQTETAPATRSNRSRSPGCPISPRVHLERTPPRSNGDAKRGCFERRREIATSETVTRKVLTAECLE